MCKYLTNEIVQVVCLLVIQNKIVCGYVIIYMWIIFGLGQYLGIHGDKGVTKQK